MAKYKVLKSVANSIAASFTSLMNYAQDDYVMGILLAYARSAGDTSFYIDFVSSTWSPVFDKARKGAPAPQAKRQVPQPSAP